TCVIPDANPHYDYEVETSDGESGTFKWNSQKKRHELEDRVTRQSSDSRSYSHGTSYDTGSSKSKGRGGFGIRLFLGAIALGAGVIIADIYTENPNRYNPSSQADIILYPRTQYHSKPRTRKAYQEARKELLKNAKDANIVEDFQAFQDSTAEPERHQEIVIPEDEFLDLKRIIVGLKLEMRANKKETLEAIESTFVANQISEKEKNYYVKIVESECNTYLDNFKTKIIGFEMFPKWQKDELTEIIYSNDLYSDSLRFPPKPLVLLPENAVSRRSIDK
ncbi:hypothetical protein HYX18_00980, partial [Candidatus Woesearchaeota archaeon]|nr:hypothetical protein [Candidatus Woesearchaeota archaeon]